MDIKEFEKNVEPRAKRSKLLPYLVQILELKNKGYANWQVCEWLEANGIKVSQEAVRKFIKSKIGSVNENPVSTSKNLTATSTERIENTIPVQKEDLQNDGSTIAEKEKKRLDDLAKTYVKDEPDNPLIGFLKKDKK